MTEPTPAGWYPDPETPGQQRYWDGNAWTQNFAPGAAPPAPQTSATKKPVYKRPWFIVIAVLFGLGVLGNMLNGTPSESTPPAPNAVESTPATKQAEVQPKPEPEPEPTPAEVAPEPEEPAEPAMSLGQEQAVQKASAYLDMGGFSRKSLIEQLKYEGFGKSDATFAADYLDPDWKAQAAIKAQAYMDMGGFSRASLIDQLEYEGFTAAEAKHGAKAVGY